MLNITPVVVVQCLMGNVELEEDPVTNDKRRCRPGCLAMNKLIRFELRSLTVSCPLPYSSLSPQPPSRNRL